MANISELKRSAFVTKGDIGQNGSLFTITGHEQVNVSAEGAAPELKWALTFRETEKPFILNSTNGQIISKFTGSEEMNDWTDKKVVIYFDPNVSYAGKLTGGLRARAPRTPQPAPIGRPVASLPPLPVPPVPVPMPMPLSDEPGEDVPFK